MKRNDIYGLGFSILLHLLVLLFLALMQLSAVEPEPLGFLEVEFGPLAEGQPVQQPAQKQPPPEPDAVEEVQEEVAAQEEEPTPVELPESKDDERIQVQEEEPDAPQEEQEPEDVVKIDAEEVAEAPEVEPDTVGAPVDPGPGEEEERATPFDISGLESRSLIAGPLPDHTDNVSAVIRMRITVDPTGRVTRIIPVMKGSPALEREAQRALQRWRFSALPANAPRADQVGIVTFRFIIE